MAPACNFRLDRVENGASQGFVRQTIPRASARSQMAPDPADQIQHLSRRPSGTIEQ